MIKYNYKKNLLLQILFYFYSKQTQADYEILFAALNRIFFDLPVYSILFLNYK